MSPKFLDHGERRSAEQTKEDRTSKVEGGKDERIVKWWGNEARWRGNKNARDLAWLDFTSPASFLNI